MSGPDAAPPRDLLARLGDRILDLGPVRWLKPIMDGYEAAGGGLLAAGLAWNALFALLPAILLLVAILGIYLNDPAQLASVALFLSERFPPIAAFVDEALTGFTRGAISFGILGLVGLVWGSTRLYQSLDIAMARIFHGSPRRDPIQRGIRGVVSVLVLLGGLIVGAYVLAFVQQAGQLIPGLGWIVEHLDTALGSFVASVVLFGAVVAVVYRIVPTVTPGWREISVPALVVGTVLAVLTAIFAVFAPRIVGSLHIYGAFVAVFAAMIWLSFVTQAILIGAAWVHRRVFLGEARRSD